MSDVKNIIIFGITDASELAHYYFENDSNYRVSAFTVDSEYIDNEQHLGLPVIPFESVEETLGTTEHDMFIALGYSRLNQLRKEKYLAAKNKGYSLATYVSSRATVLNEGAIGDNCFILEDNTVQPFVSIGNNVTLWSGNHVGHHSRIEDHCFLASQIVVSGRVSIGEACFIGVNTTIRDNITIGENCIIGAGSRLLTDIEANGVYSPGETERSRVPSHRLKNI